MEDEFDQMQNSGLFEIHFCVSPRFRVLVSGKGGGVVGAYLSLSGSERGRWGWGGRLFEAGRLLTFSAFRMGAYLRWVLIRGLALIRINTVFV